MLSQNFDNAVTADARDKSVIGAIVFGGAHGSLAVIRSLGRQGVPVWFLAHDNKIAKYSRYTKKCIDWCGAKSPLALEFLLELAREHKLNGWVLFPGGDAEAQLIAQNHEALARVYRLITQPWQILQAAQDKTQMYALAHRLGVDHPWIYDQDNPPGVDEVQAHFPLVIKPVTGSGQDKLSKDKAWRVEDAKEFSVHYARAVSLLGRSGIVVQEMIPGDGWSQYSYAAISHKGKPVASLVVRRSRQYPVDFGFTSTMVETVNQPLVEKHGSCLIEALNYSGMVEIEFKYDARDERFKVLDINTRTWTWIGLGSVAGVDFPYIMWRLATGKSVSPTTLQTDAAWCHLSRDILANIAQPKYKSESGAKFRNILAKKITFAAYASDDPLPGLLDIPLLLPRLLTRLKLYMFSLRQLPQQ